MDGSRDSDESLRRRQQQQQHVQPSTSNSPEQRLDVTPMISWQQRPIAPSQEQTQQQQQHLSQRPYDYIPSMPLQTYPNPAGNQSLGSASYTALPLQYPSPHNPYYVQQQQQQQHHTASPTQSQYNLPYAAYASPPPRPQPGTATAAASSLPLPWYATSENFFPEQIISLPPHVSPLISPHDSSRHLSLAKPVSPRDGSGPMQSPIEEGARWTSYASSGPRGPSLYPSGMVGAHRGSYSTMSMSSSGSTSRSPSQSISQGQHQYQSSSTGGLASSNYKDISATSMIMPPPNPPLEVQTSLEPEMQRRAATACNFCRARKLRCDGSAPCRQCARRDLECVFSQTNPARRRKRQNDDDDGDSGARKTSSAVAQRSASQSGGLDSRRGSSNYEVKSSSNSKSGSDQHDEINPRSKQARIGGTIFADSASDLKTAFQDVSNFSLQHSAIDPVWMGEVNWCRSPLPPFTTATWQQTSRPLM